VASRRYQAGTIEKVKTKLGPVWYVRFTAEDGTRPRTRLGTLKELPTKANAQRAVSDLRKAFNSKERVPLVHSFGDVIARYTREEMPQTYSTRKGYEKINRLYIEPKWGAFPLDEVNAFEVRAWLKSLDRSSRTRGHIHGQMRILFKFAMLWNWLPLAVNPMSLFSLEGATKRTKTPRVITPQQFRGLLQNEKKPDRRAMLVGAYMLGVRVSELFALQWGDFDFLGMRVTIRRAIVDAELGKVKTTHSGAPLPLSPFVRDAFQEAFQASEYRENESWVFASRFTDGDLPYRSARLQQRMLVPAGKAIGLDFKLGWHTFRHSYRVLLERSGADITVQRDLMRHADVHTTMQVYGGEVEMDRLREANLKAEQLMLKGDR